MPHFSEFYSLKELKKQAEPFIKMKLSTNAVWAKAAMLKVYDKQTEDEKVSETTKHLNRVGFSGVDAELLSSFSKQMHSRGFLTAKQMRYVFKKMPKYWEQIFNMSDKNKLVEAMK